MDETSMAIYLSLKLNRVLYLLELKLSSMYTWIESFLDMSLNFIEPFVEMLVLGGFTFLSALDIMCMNKYKQKSSRGGLGVERWSNNRLHSALVDRIPLGETIPAITMFYVDMVPTPTNISCKYN